MSTKIRTGGPRAACLAVLGLLLLTSAAAAQRAFPPCDGLVFSTEEDFLARGTTPADGVPLISDGDLISHNYPGPGAEVCARNRDLLEPFQVRVDLGLDAVDVVDPFKFLVAFSTELDDPFGKFTAGDLLVTNGGILPNAALMARFEKPIPEEDFGLDAVHLVGDTERIIRILVLIAERGRGYWLEKPEALSETLKELGVDIWFSTEGTGWSPKEPSFLDGDLLSARDGVIVESNADLLPALPAGLPARGVDFGLDAFTQEGELREQRISGNLFSTEIVSLDRVLSFTDGDLLRQGAGVVLKNIDLINSFEPAARDLGLDAVDLGGERPCEEAVEITEVGGIQLSLIDPFSGYARKMLGAYPPPPPPAAAPFDRPFGQWVSVRGTVPDDRCIDVRQYEYRVEFEGPVGGWQPIITHPNWQANLSGFCGGFVWSPYQSDPVDGWIPLADYWLARQCQPSHPLNVWRTTGRDRLHKLRLTVRKIGDPTSEILSSEVPVMLDNTKPTPVQMTLYDGAGINPLTDQCEVEATPPATVITIKGRARDNGTNLPSDGDEHFYRYTLRWTGGDNHFWNSVDLAPGEPADYRFYDNVSRADLGNAGTEPPGDTAVPLGQLDLTAEHMAVTGNPPTECGYTIQLRAYDRTIRGGFAPTINFVNDGAANGWSTPYMQSFCFAPGAPAA